MTSRKILYAAGEPLGSSATARRLDGRYLCGGGGGSSSNDSNPVTTNTDKRNAVQNGIGQSGDGMILTSADNSTKLNVYDNHVDNSNSPDAVIAIADAGAKIIKDSGGAVVDLAKFQGAQNTEAWNTTVTQGAKLIDNIIEQTGNGLNLASKAIDNFAPTENKNADIGKYAMVAAAAVAMAVLFKG